MIYLRVVKREDLKSSNYKKKTIAIICNYVVTDVNQTYCTDAQSVNNPPATQQTWVRSLGLEGSLENEMATQLLQASILAWKFRGQKSLAGYSLKGGKESDMPQ